VSRFVYCSQNSAEWLDVRCGRITASRMADVVTTLKRKSKSGEKGDKAAGYEKYMLELVAERMTGRTAESYVSPWMDRGSEFEPLARAAYEIGTGAMVDRIGFAIHPLMDFSGASPDGLVDTDGCLEIKVPKTETHIAWRRAKVVPEEYLPQMHWEMECCERNWNDFVSFAPEMPSYAQVFCVRLDYDPLIAAEYRQHVADLNGEVEAIIAEMGGTPTTYSLKELLRKSVAEIDAEQFITDADLPKWAHEMREAQ
jgi:putative phage-type endonuclease